MDRPKMAGERTGRSGSERPQYLIIGGVYKAGTTSLYHYLADHPDVCASSNKETRFFLDLDYPVPSAHRYLEGLEAYERYFSGCDKGKLRMESTPFYLYSPGTAQRIHDMLGPDTRMLFVLRDPIARLFSSYGYSLQRNGRSQLSFRDYVDGLAANLEDGGDPASNQLTMGRYSAFIKHYLSVFPRDQVQVLIFRELVDRPLDSLESVCRFADLDFSFYQAYRFEVHNPTVRYDRPIIAAASRGLDQMRPFIWRHIADKPLLHRPLRRLKRWMVGHLQARTSAKTGGAEIDADTLQMLTEYYRPDVHRLAELIERELPWEPWAA